MQSRPATKGDEAFLFELFCSVRAATLAHANLSAAELNPLLRMQYTGQHRTYASQFPDAEHAILSQDGQDVGACYVSRTEAEIRLVDVALLPAHRQLGRGTAVVRGLQDEARSSGRMLRLSVDINNTAARRLYARLGFEQVGSSPTQLEMAWRGGR